MIGLTRHRPHREPAIRSHELTLGRSFGVAFDHGEDFFTTLAGFCQQHHVRHAYIPGFIAGFSEVRIVGTCDKPDDPDAPIWSGVHLTNVEALGSGTLAYDEANDQVHPHIHVSVGLKTHSATAYTSHLLQAQVQFLTEMLIIEVTSPELLRHRNTDLYNVPQLHFGRHKTSPTPSKEN
ncbi:PPC domain-containing DNA-binding protein [Saccharothrix lopnurensis]|uniref:PPC domain-containing DNA-binding protein n=1 Tax=Saccharothrix lopnurensis TaxID=1670621 RepID=A0ABW1P8Y8_9PSEU